MKYDLKGEWQLEYNDNTYKATIPGCNYLDLQSSGVIPDPFMDDNEMQVQEVSQIDCKYSKIFKAGKELLKNDHIELVAKGLDTICNVSLNGEKIALCKNAYQVYRINIKNIIKLGDNKLEIEFFSPKNYVTKKQKEDPLVKNFMGLTGIQHLRKPSYHFGWDWGPTLIPSGIVDDIFIDAYKARIEDILIMQKHNNGKVCVTATIKTKPLIEGSVRLNITTPNGEVIREEAQVVEGSCAIKVIINNAMLWYPNGMGDQPLYLFEYALIEEDDSLLDTISQKIGLRTIELDTKKDNDGSNFCFLINGKKIFAKGANWIPSDSFITRTTILDIEFYIKSAKDANMNMLRVWGGGYYESDAFYDLCDKYGILVWQDFCYACYPYPFYDKEFEHSALVETEQQINRLKHHASLTLWCGNNEIELMAPLWFYKSKLKKAQYDFFYNKLKKLVDDIDGATPYWPGSPSSGYFLKNVNSDNYGDTHLWQVWHGLRPPEYYKKRASRFISEFGMQSMPSRQTIEKYSKNIIAGPRMYPHQKCMGGNQKMLYYLLCRYHLPKSFNHLVYLSQLTQARIVETAIVNWRMDKKCNGALFWQYNDCWPVSSWSAIDYLGEYKALFWSAKRFFAPIKLAIRKEKDEYNVYCINDTESTIKGKVQFCALSFNGQIIKEVESECNVINNTVSKVCSFALDKTIKNKKKNIYIIAKLYDNNGDIVAVERELCVADKYAKLPKTNVDVNNIILKDGIITIELKADAFARNVYVESALPLKFSDNYFDMDSGQSKSINCIADKDIDITTLKQSIKITTMSDIERATNNFYEAIKRIGLILYPPNLINAIAQLFN